MRDLRCGRDCSCCEYNDGTAPCDHDPLCELRTAAEDPICTCEGSEERAQRRKGTVNIHVRWCVRGGILLPWSKDDIVYGTLDDGRRVIARYHSSIVPYADGTYEIPEDNVLAVTDGVAWWGRGELRL